MPHLERSGMAEAGSAMQRYLGWFHHQPAGPLPPADGKKLRLCLLIRLRLGNVQLASIFSVSPASISQKKFRLKKHLSEWGESGFHEEMTLVCWLTEF
ncbi:hypothetical protein [uncultured Bacteroides sp.]|uniref:hypothetical protein n=1 Tax=uncultured Bacteroides sp. TaxID=162156 RepID=UPI00280B5F55|nr:hypothetical protein [uncultured Bacteroides sp.]